ncbi:MAG TPA: superoxide dismutase [Saprospiraceae bacterium]|nr:superoxide dismutase [Saprospiraceae bacterium]HQW56454.1 superoxide dismutase [Saprospiraceae bacterium]
MAFTLPDLGYDFNALEPNIDAETMQIHHDRHHKAYVDNLNKALEGKEGANLSIEEILKDISKYETAVRNNGGGHYNHSIFWKMIAPGGSTAPSGELASKINEKFGSFEGFKEQFAKAAATRFGSGWAWLCMCNTHGLNICSTPNQDNPIMDVSTDCHGLPILGLDVWEHAYYLKYQNKRPDYVNAFFNIINWDEVNRRYEHVLSLK